MIEQGFTQFVNSPTWGDHFLDLVFFNDDFAVNDVNVGSLFSSSDHNSITSNLVYLCLLLDIHQVILDINLLLMIWN